MRRLYWGFQKTVLRMDREMSYVFDRLVKVWKEPLKARESWFHLRLPAPALVCLALAPVLTAVLAGAGRALVLGAAALPVALSLGVECWRRWRLRRTSLMDTHVRCQCILRLARELDGAVYTAIDRSEKGLRPL
ncbi:hypothetical protein [Bittarella massiliensis (ex Durand et al. 2017)]|uniref:Uncharacterized protein n=2 Tax=Eubacteriales TaxID=186802 RepID=A0AAQ1MFG1_9FIRM|nr:hypothetical protein [Bittarella massiliensis (ex Durand et al. 2017)]MZL69423.1 hypothetical protein [Bittarella massiliensis (ex Durand et al. 2017)]MZL79035.1 hypothetical protein [Bittarella massiliensis (ex Durand et al. 2017)]SHG47137.1 hypothetical protein SAMN05444424_2490 [Bittarella massiliensis (ex Durand et al. 2017)]